MASSLPHRDDPHRWPPLDGHGPLAIDDQYGYRRPRRSSANVAAIDRTLLLASDSGDGSGAAHEQPDDRSINGNLPDSPLDWEFHITQAAFVDAMNYLCGRPPEAAGILLGPADDEPLVTRFIPDHIGQGTTVAFELHAPFLNHVLQELRSHGLTCKGIIHSHPAGVSRPSNGDMDYFRRLFSRPANAEATHLFVPIVCNGRLHPYVFHSERIVPAMLVVV